MSADLQHDETAPRRGRAVDAELEGLRALNAELEGRLREAEETLAAIGAGDVDALVVGADVYTLDSANAASNAMRKDVLAQMQDAVLAFDDEDHLIFMNPAAEAQYGRGASEMLGRLRSELYRERWVDPALAQRSLRALREQGSYRSESIHQRGDGREIHVESTVARLDDASGRPLGVLCVIRDIGERVEAQARLEFTLAAARFGEWEIDIASGACRHSPMFDRCFGLDEPADPWNLDVLISHVHADDRQRVSDLVARCFRDRSTLEFECRVTWPDASVHWIEVQGSPYFEPTPKPEGLRYLGIVSDITERKHAEATLRDADVRKDEFLATLAHELRNPLAPIRNAVQIMQLSREDHVHDKARRIIERQLKQMVHLVDDLLDISRISQGKLELRRESADVASVVMTAVETSRPLIDAGHHELTIRLGPPRALRVDVDVTRLCQIVANLLNNAAKYTPEGGRIEVSAEREGTQALIRVRDTGIGISREMLPRVFDMFAQVDRSTARTQGGLGIGLALVKRLIEMHGGSVTAASDGPDRGSSFVLRLPLVQDTADRTAPVDPPPLVPGMVEHLRVLVVDDNVDSAQSLSELLSMLGYDTSLAYDGVEAVEAVRAHPPAIALLDIGMPRMNGLEAARAIRQLPLGEQVILIALSGWGQEEDRRQSAAAGFDHHFVKPLDVESLLEVIRKLRAR